MNKPAPSYILLKHPANKTHFDEAGREDVVSISLAEDKVWLQAAAKGVNNFRPP
jgi:hypothetical protein